jgi:hypothetical protein
MRRVVHRASAAGLLGAACLLLCSPLAAASTPRAAVGSAATAAATARSATTAAARFDASKASGKSGKSHSSNSTTLASPQLWATIDVCKLTNGKPTVGVRGSMPSDGHSGDVMYMRFGLQYLDSGTGKWSFLPGSVEASFTELGKGGATRQSGRNFQLTTEAKSASYELRGVVEFQWRNGSKIVLSATKQTSAGHGKTVRHAEPAGYSAATCKVE